MPLLFIAAFALTLALYIFRTRIHYLAYARPDDPGADLEHELMPVAAFIVVGFIAMVAFDPLRFDPTLPGRLVGLGAALLGAWMLADAIQKKSGFGESDYLVKDGVYHVIRHPMYTGIILLHFGVAVLGGAGLTLASCVIWTGVLLLWRHWEEVDLELKFGGDYWKYRRKTLF